MKHVKVAYLAVLLATLWGATAGAYEEDEVVASEELPSPSFGAEIDFNPRYVWRALAASNGAVMQPSAWIEWSGILFTTWANIDLTEEEDRGRFNEVDLILAYSHDFDNLTVTPEVQVWFYPNQEDTPTTGEAALTLSYAIAGPLSVFTEQHFDIVEYPGAYSGSLGVSVEHEFSPQASVAAAASVLWASSKFNETYIGVAKNALNAVLVGFSFTLTPIEHLTVRPHVEISSVVDNDLRDALDEPALINTGVAVGVEF